MSFASEPLPAIISSTCREPGEIVRLTPGAMCLPSSSAATFSMSSSEELVQLPMET